MIQLTKGGDVLPETFEEWVEIHGEPDYIGEEEYHELDIKIIKPDTKEPVYDTSILMDMKANGDIKINYTMFVDYYKNQYKCVYSNGTFYSPDGMISPMKIRQDIYNMITEGGWTSKGDTPTTSILNSLKDKSHVDSLSIKENAIPVANGTIYINKDGWEFYEGERKPAPYRLSVNFNPNPRPMPLFSKWLNDLFNEEDIITIQEIMGYCLLPTTFAQEAFFLVGEGGAGKSGLGTILEGIMGNAYIPINTQELFSGRFGMSSLENKLIAYDDDLGSGALTETGNFKKLITADQKISAERKFGDPYDFRPYCRLIACTNFMIRSLYDDSEGFYRRLHPIHVKPPEPNRKHIRGFYKMILEQEKESIFSWALEGLHRVMDNGWCIHWSKRSRVYMSQFKSEGTHFPDFIEDTCEFSEDAQSSTAELKRVYKNWCRENAITPASDRRLEKWLGDNCEKYKIKRDKHIKRGNKDIRGYKGLSIKPEWNNDINF